MTMVNAIVMHTQHTQNWRQRYLIRISSLWRCMTFYCCYLMQQFSRNAGPVTRFHWWNGSRRLLYGTTIYRARLLYSKSLRLRGAIVVKYPDCCCVFSTGDPTTVAWRVCCYATRLLWRGAIVVAWCLNMKPCEWVNANRYCEWVNARRYWIFSILAEQRPTDFLQVAL